MQLFCKLIYGESVQEKKFTYFTLLPEDTQLLVLSHYLKDSDRRSHLQGVNRQWSKVVSIKHPKIFDFCCNIDHLHMSRIFLCAVYNSNYDGAENILKNSYLNKIENKNLCYRNIYNNESGYEGVLDPYHIAREDKQMVQLLEKYNVTNLSVKGMSDKVPCQPTPLIMACLAGDSSAISSDIKGDKENVRKALNIIVACDYEKCMRQMIEVLRDEFGDLFSYDKDGDELERKLLRRACINNSCKVLEILLDNTSYDLNNIFNNVTLLDEALKLKENDSSFHLIVASLKKRDAKTAQEITAERAAEAEDRKYMPFAWQ